MLPVLDSSAWQTMVQQAAGLSHGTSDAAVGTAARKSARASQRRTAKFYVGVRSLNERFQSTFRAKFTNDLTPP